MQGEYCYTTAKQLYCFAIILLRFSELTKKPFYFSPSTLKHALSITEGCGKKKFKSNQSTRLKNKCQIKSTFSLELISFLSKFATWVKTSATDYCANQKLLQHSSKSQNVFNKLFQCHRYLETVIWKQHKIFKFFGELIIQVRIDRSEYDVDFLCQKLLDISQKIWNSTTHLSMVRRW